MLNLFVKLLSNDECAVDAEAMYVGVLMHVLRQHHPASNHVLLPISTFPAAGWNITHARTVSRAARSAGRSWYLCSSQRYSQTPRVSISSSSSRGDMPYSSRAGLCSLI